jgi:hypothetical protein
LGTAVTVEIQTLCEHYDAAELANLNLRRLQQERRENLRSQLAENAPLFRFSRELLQWLVDEGSAVSAPPSCDIIHVAVHD